MIDAARNEMLSIAGIRITPTTARLYFGVQSAAGAAWWISVFMSDVVRGATLGDLPVNLVAALDIPLFVIGSLLIACGIRWMTWVVVPWTALVAAVMAVYATVTTMAGWGALLMVLAALGGVGGAIVLLCGRVPTEWLIAGPFAFRTAKPARRSRLLARTGLQAFVFWTFFLAVVPMVIAVVEARWLLEIPFPLALRIAGGVLLVIATGLGVWSAAAMSLNGEGTPLPSHMPRRLVVSGPYRFVRNPMAVAGIVQGVAVGVMLGSWMVVAYALCGSLVWNTLIRPLEEEDLRARFGAAFEHYQSEVSCWLPTIPRSPRDNASTQTS